MYRSFHPCSQISVEKIMNRDLFQGFIECERGRIHDEQLAVLTELKTAYIR